MEQQTIQIIEKLFQEKVLLYAELLESFRKEQDCLRAMNIDSLWAVSDEKNRICSEIVTLRSRIASTLGLERDLEEKDVVGLLESMPAREHGSLRNTLLRIMELKEEVEMMRKENQCFIDESLGFLDEMIALLAGERAGAMVYSGKSRLQRTEGVCTMTREV